MKVFNFLLNFVFGINAFDVCMNSNNVTNQCIQFSVTSGTGCAWMCSYCANQLGTNNYYFTDGVCSYQSSAGCVGNPVAGKSYTCCSV
jgi:hypothetical protein